MGSENNVLNVCTFLSFSLSLGLYHHVQPLMVCLQNFVELMRVKASGIVTLDTFPILKKILICAAEH